MTSKRPNRSKHNTLKKLSAEVVVPQRPASIASNSEKKKVIWDLTTEKGRTLFRKALKRNHLINENGQKQKLAAVLVYIKLTNEAKYKNLMADVKYIRKNLTSLKMEKLTDQQKKLRLKRILEKTKFVAESGLHNGADQTVNYNQLVDEIVNGPAKVLLAWNKDRHKILKIWVDRINLLSRKPLYHLIKLLKINRTYLKKNKANQEDYIPLVIEKIIESAGIKNLGDSLRQDDLTNRIHYVFKNYKI